MTDVNENNFSSEIQKAVAECSAFSVIPSFTIEKKLAALGHALIAGIDEAGRGALAGPLCVGLVIYRLCSIRSSDSMAGINDSKKLTHGKRVKALAAISENSLVATSALVSHRIVDRLNVNRATEYALRLLLDRVPVKPDIVLLDGNFSFQSPVPIISIPKGDTLSVSIASASIVAKVRRDAVLDKIDALYPGYDFRSNKGYGTRGHIRAIYDIGFTPLHRRSYEPVKSLIAGGRATCA